MTVLAYKNSMLYVNTSLSHLNYIMPILEYCSYWAEKEVLLHYRIEVLLYYRNTVLMSATSIILRIKSCWLIFIPVLRR